MRYKAVLRGVQGLERDLQLLSSTKKGLDSWIKDVLLRNGPEGYIEIYELEEILIETVRSETAEEKKLYEQ